MRVVCPECGSRDVRYSRTRGLGEKLRKVFGIHPVRCRDCRHRFLDDIWKLSLILYARCPRCYKVDLGVWSLEQLRPTTRQQLLIHLGARPYRCKACRMHFVSFRRRRRVRSKLDTHTSA